MRDVLSRLEEQRMTRPDSPDSVLSSPSLHLCEESTSRLTAREREREREREYLLEDRLDEELIVTVIRSLLFPAVKSKFLVDFLFLSPSLPSSPFVLHPFVSCSTSGVSVSSLKGITEEEMEREDERFSSFSCLKGGSSQCSNSWQILQQGIQEREN